MTVKAKKMMEFFVKTILEDPSIKFRESRDKNDSVLARKRIVESLHCVQQKFRESRGKNGSFERIVILESKNQCNDLARSVYGSTYFLTSGEM